MSDDKDILLFKQRTFFTSRSSINSIIINFPMEYADERATVPLIISSFILLFHEQIDFTPLKDRTRRCNYQLFIHNQINLIPC